MPSPAQLNVMGRPARDTTPKKPYNPADHPYPSWRYHATNAPVLVATKAQDDELGSAWAKSPADVVSADPADDAAKGKAAKGKAAKA